MNAAEEEEEEARTNRDLSSREIARCAHMVTSTSRSCDRRTLRMDGEKSDGMI
jgi:hypothetical protein